MVTARDGVALDVALVGKVVLALVTQELLVSATAVSAAVTVVTRT